MKVTITDTYSRKPDTYGFQEVEFFTTVDVKQTNTASKADRATDNKGGVYTIQGRQNFSSNRLRYVK